MPRRRLIGSLIALALDVVVLFALTARWGEAKMDLTDR